jgi:hypothetical protein
MKEVKKMFLFCLSRVHFTNKMAQIVNVPVGILWQHSVSLTKLFPTLSVHSARITLNFYAVHFTLCASKICEKPTGAKDASRTLMKLTSSLSSLFHLFYFLANTIFVLVQLAQL